MRKATWRVGALLLGSGFCALVYQVGWLRDFRLIFGASTAASAAVLAIFIGGLGVGSLLLGPRADRHPRPLLFYSQLETVIAVSAAASPLLLALVRRLYLASGGSTVLGLTLSTIERLVLSTLVLAIPTIAMGGTLPAAARSVTSDEDVRRHDLAMLYGLNTLGAVVGCVIATFFLLELFGTRQTMWLAAAVNVLIAVIARQVDRTGAGQVEWAGEGTEAGGVHPAPPAPPAFVLAASAIVGFAFFLMELVWYRLLAPLLGGSVFTFGLVLAIALVGIGVGGLLYTLAGERRPATLGGFATSCLVEALAVAATFAIGDRIAILTLVLVPLRSVGFAAHVAGWTLIAALVVLPPALVAGYQFPLLIALLGRGRERIGRQVGFTYAANTFGAIVGSLAGGFGILPWLSAPGTWRLVACALAALGGVGAVLASGLSYRNVALRLAAPAATVALLFATGPTSVWRQGGIGAGRAPVEVLETPNALRAWVQSARSWVVWQGDGVESSVALVYGPAGYAFLVNGKSDGSARGDAGTQVMLGLLGALSHPAPRRALVIGLGTGATAGWLAGVSTIERVDTIELEPLVLDVARACDATNFGAMRNPKVRIAIGDARETLLTGRDRYDIIASEPSNPFRAGIASLFTQEFYEAASVRLTEDGVFAQWVQAYEIDAPTLRTVYATVGAVFPQVDTWQTQRGDIVLLASKRPRTYSAPQLAARIAQEPFRTALADAWRATDVNALLAHYLASDVLTRTIVHTAGIEVNSDDRNTVEFGLARSVGRSGATITTDLHQLASRLNAARPPLSDPTGVSWPAVDTARVAYNAADGAFSDIPLNPPPAESARQQALFRFFQSGDIAGTRELWQSQVDGPRDLVELEMLSEVEARSGSEAALPLIDRLRTRLPAEADTFLAMLRAQQGRAREAAAALSNAFVRMRSDPWSTLDIAQKALNLADPIAARDPSTAPQLFEALRQRFAVAVADRARLVAAAGLSRRMDFARTCRVPLDELEPFVPWNAEMLTLRRNCYQATGDPRLAVAVRELADFYAHEPAPLASGLRLDE